MKRTLVLALIIILCVTAFQGLEERWPGTAHAESATQGETTAETLYVRAEPNTDARILGAYPKGTTVDLRGTEGEWYQVSFNNSTGYIHSDHVKTGQTAQGSSLGSGEITAASLNVRASASDTARVTSSVKRGQQVELLAKTGEWYEIKAGHKEGFIHASYVNTSGASESSSTVEASTAASGSGEITASALYVRSSPETSASIVASLSRGSTVDLLEESGSWYKIQTGSTTGYVHSSYVNTSGEPDTTEVQSAAVTKGEVTTSSLNIRAEASTSAKKLGSLGQGTEVDIHEKSGDWFTIKTSDGGWGYVNASYVRETGLTAETSGSGSGSLSGKTIFLDPGHGGKDPGAVAPGVYEKTIVLSLSKKVRQRLEQEGAQVVMSRSDDTFLPLSSRSALANQAGADLFISVHANSFANTAANGAEVLYSSIGRNPNDSRMLALELQESIANGTSLTNRGTVNRSVQVLNTTNMPAVLIEPGFITHAGDLSVLLNEQDRLAAEIVNGLKNYYR